MKQLDYNETFEILDTIFNGVEELIKHAISGEPKNGVFVGYDSKGYPCFDSYDYASENRSYWNFVLAKNKEELAERLSHLKQMSPLKTNYNKLTENLHPMAYWGGEDYKSFFLTEGRRENVESSKTDES